MDKGGEGEKKGKEGYTNTPLEKWSVGVMEDWSTGGLEYWRIGVLEDWRT